ncbi:RNP-1 like RNA-binding protein [Candidatus Omnitrophus magneticus]|uniref:RNP-1 like RNA-binding protein n=1 Tax=Candidatus Omnitrophus magneticus TaxID=1609969 RepID=A0A0F0CSI8_9BACT|nr:RNP-1 like RNA-binding protein [Candidatus Omnitrophus magneticus]
MEGSKLYVGNLKYSVTSAELNELFGKYGQVKEAAVINGRGFGFVEMSTPEEAEKAQTDLNGKDFQGRALVINEARPRENNGGGNGGSRPPRRPFGGGGSRGGFRGGNREQRDRF